jgi:predicted DNA-binding transcriptional regulator AlpA
MPDTPYFLDVRTFCRTYGLSRSTLLRLVNRGQGPRLGRIGAKLVISVPEAEAWAKRVEAQTHVPGGQQS